MHSCCNINMLERSSLALQSMKDLALQSMMDQIPQVLALVQTGYFRGALSGCCPCLLGISEASLITAWHCMLGC